MMFCGGTNPKGGFLSLSSFLLATSYSSDGEGHAPGRMDVVVNWVDLWRMPRLFMVVIFSLIRESDGWG